MFATETFNVYTGFSDSFGSTDAPGQYIYFKTSFPSIPTVIVTGADVHHGWNGQWVVDHRYTTVNYFVAFLLDGNVSSTEPITIHYIAIA